MSFARQPDLFAATGIAVASPAPHHEPRPRLVPSELEDAALIAAIAEVRPANCGDLSAEIAGRRLIEAVPALEALCPVSRDSGCITQCLSRSLR